MCQNAQATAYDLLTGIEPTIATVLNVEGISTSAPPGSLIMMEYSQAALDVKNWRKGTSAQEAIEAVTDIENALTALPLPPTEAIVLNTILAGLATVIGILDANQPAPAPPADATASPEEVQAAHAAFVAAATTEKVQTLVPGIERSRFHTPADQYKKAWNKAVASNPKYAGREIN